MVDMLEGEELVSSRT